MKRTFVLFATFLLVFQLVLPGFSGELLLEAEGENKVLTVDSMTELDNQIETVINWTVNQTEVKENYHESIQLKDKYTLSSGEDVQLVYKEDEEDILYDDEVIGNYTVSEDGTFSIVFSEDLGELIDSNISGEVTVVAHIIENESEKDGTAREKKPVEIESPNDEQESESTIDKATTKKKTDRQESKSKRTVENNKQFNDNMQDGFKVQFSEILDFDKNPYNDENPLKADSEFFIKLDWELLQGHNYQAGDTENIQLPEQIKIGKPITGGELKDDFGNLVATYEVNTDGIVQITFTDYVENNSDVTGWIEIRAQLDQDKAQEEDGKIIINPIGEEGEQTIPIERSQKDKKVEKQGQPNKSYNADEIEWTVTLNKNAQTLKDVSLEDLLPEGTEYKEGSLKVVKQAASINGTPIGDATEVTVTPSVEDGKLVIPLGDIEDIYTLTYTTTVLDMEKKDFKNNVVFKDKELDDIETNATVTINRGEPLNKGKVGGHAAYDPKKGIITWYVEFNYDQKSLNNVTLSDAWTPEGKVELVEDSVKFQEMTIDENGKAHPVGGAPVSPSEIGATLTKKEDGFDISGITTDRPYYIVYETKVKERVVDKKGFTVNNKVSFEDNEHGDGHYIGQKVGLKSAGKVNYQDKTIEWTIRINSDERPMKDITITDTLGAGLTLIEDSVAMTIDGEPYTKYKLEDGNPFKLTDIPDTDKEIIVTYKTKFKADDIPGRKAENEATISWIPEDESERLELDVAADKQLNRHTEDNSWKAGKYDPQSKEITWNIVVNYRENDFENLIIYDTPQQNQQLIPGSVTVNEVEIKADGTFGTVTEVKSKISTDDNEVIIEIGKTKKAYLISYKTSLKDLTNIEKQYTNKATVKDGDKTIKDIEGKVGIYGEEKYGAKHGYQEGKQVHWKIDVNLAQEKIDNLQLHDEISDNQEYLKDSIKVYEANLKLEGEGTKPEVSKVEATKGELVSADRYELDIKGNEFTIKWNETVNEAFIVEYSTLFFIETDEDVTNKYTITGENIPEDESSSSNESAVYAKLTTAGAAQGGAGYLIIKKLDTSYGLEVKPIEGIEFELLDARTDKVLKTIMTDEKGHADFGRLLFGDYELREVNVPEGYVTLEETQIITIEESYIPGEDDPLEYVLEVENFKPNHNIELLKKDDKDKVLEGAEFTLFTENGNEVEKQTTDADGNITFKNVEPGNYYIQETKAPKGYELDSTQYPVEITEKQREPIELEISNDPIKTSVSVEKVWKGSEETSVNINLFADGEKVDSIELSAENNWTYVFDNLPVYKYGEDLEEIEYTIEEVEIDGYESDITGSQEDGYTVTNLRVGETEVPVEKVWKGEAASNVTINLLANGEEIASIDLTEENNWTHIFTDLAEFDEEGQPIEYTVEEVDIDGYESNITGSQEDGYTVTNLRVGKTEVPVEKVWKGSEEESVTINLLANGNEVDFIELSTDNDWTHTFTDLAEFDEEGQLIDYTVEELEIEGYTSSITGDAEEGFTVTNTRSGTTEVTINKSWKDDNDATKDRPNTINVNLLQNSIVYGDSHEVSASDDWSLTISDLPKYDDEGVEYEYTISEHDIPGYEAEILGFDITNTRTDEKTIEITKAWLDDNSENRPTEIVVELLRSIENGDKEKVDTYKVTAEENWSLIIDQLPVFDEDGKAYTYEIEEREIDGYETTINGFDITNLRVGTTEVSGTKTWKNDSKADRPDSITVILLANGEKVTEQKVTDQTDWKYTFADLPKYDQSGKEIIYTVDEVTVEGYETTIDGFNITNTLIPEDSEDPEKPSKEDPEVPETPGKDTPEDPKEKDQGGFLPKTATQIFAYIALGLGLIALGAIFQVARRRKTE